MPYHVYIPFITKFLLSKDNPCILEIGVDVGQTLLPVVHNLIVTGRPFKYVGLDVRLDVGLATILNYFAAHETQHVEYCQANSLEWLPECEMTFDLILIDGDHNYHTVSQELKFLNALLKKDGICICDDYSGKWAKKDLFYSTRETHREAELATEKVETSKHGVRTAIDEFAKNNPDWKLTSMTHSESIVLMRRETAMALGV